MRTGSCSLLLSFSEEQSPVSVLLYFFFLPEFKAEHQRHVPQQAETHRTWTMECHAPLPPAGQAHSLEERGVTRFFPMILSSPGTTNSAENEDKLLHSRNLCTAPAPHNMPPPPPWVQKLSLQRFHVTDGLPYVTSPQLSPCKQILSGFRRKSLINKWCAQLCT